MALILLNVGVFIGFVGYAVLTMNLVKVSGPLYTDIVMGKDLIADILPPPAYIIESWLTVNEMMLKSGAEDSGIFSKKMTALENDYQTRLAVWQKDLPSGAMKDCLVEKSRIPAETFFKLYQTEFLPAFLEGRHADALRILKERMRPEYLKHRTAIDEVVKISTNQNAATEKDAVSLIRTRLLWLIGLGVLSIILLIGLGQSFASGLIRPLVTLAQAAKRIAQGDVNQKVEHQSSDEIGTLAETFRQMAVYLQEMAGAAKAMAKGDMSAKIHPRSAEDVLGNNFKETVQVLQALIKTLADLKEAAQEGRLSERGDTGRFEGAYRDIIQGFNDTLQAVTVPINEASVALERMAGKDLTARMNGSYKGDHAKIKEALNKAVENLDRSLQQVATGASQVASASGEIGSGSQVLAQGASEQASSLEEVSSSLQEMTSMTKQNTANAREAKSLSDAAKKGADKGVANMLTLSTAVERIKKSSDATAKIIKTIDEIAFQTNLLALNAAVEAARAGDAGKGFAVVAEEVRNLAMRSAEAAKNTANMIEESVKNAENGVSLNLEVMTNFEEINAQVSKVSAMMAEIATASEQQSHGIEQVNTAVQQLSQLTQQSAANSEESASAAEELSAQAQEMQTMVSSFQISGEVLETEPTHHEKAAGKLQRMLGNKRGG